MNFRTLRTIALVSLIVFISCETEPFINDSAVEKIDNSQRNAPKVDVCHYDKSEDTWKILNISSNALNAHLRHGDIQLIDADQDGYVEQMNDCVPGGDCNDMDPEINPGMIEICGNGIDDNCNGLIDEQCNEVDLAYSIRKFFNWSNAVLKIRRSSDNQTAYLFFDGEASIDIISLNSYISTSSNTTADETTLGNWIGIDDGFVEQWIPQSVSNSINDNLIVSQAVLSNQFKLISSGSLITKGGLPSMSGDTNDWLKSTSSIPALDSGNNWTISLVGSKKGSNVIGTAFCTSNSSNLRSVIFLDQRSIKRAGFIQTPSGTYGADLLQQQNNTDQRLISVIGNSDQYLTSYFNGSEQSSVNYSNSYINDTVRIGSQFSNLTALNGFIQEVQIYYSDQTSKLSSIHNDINTFYSIY